MTSWIWAAGLVRRRAGRLAGMMLGIAVAVALLATLGGFFAATRAGMTRQAIADVAVDWQVQLAPGGDPQAAMAELSRGPGYTHAAQIGYADSPGFEATTGDTVQTTGPGKVLGLDPAYRAAFPQEIRDLLGQGAVLLAQQTAANLHATPGTVVSVRRPGLDPITVTIDGIVDLPLADSLFQTIGAPVGATPSAPPDNVLLLPLSQWHAYFDPVARIAPDAVHMQLHVALPHDLPSDPTTAYVDVTGKTRNYETRLAGGGTVGDNLASRLDVARADALYAQMLFLFLGLPGLLLAAILTAVLVASGAPGRRRDQALLRLRGASMGRVLATAGVEALLVGAGGVILGLVVAAMAVRAIFGRWGFGLDLAQAALWAGSAAFGGLMLALLTILVPAWRDTRETNIAAARGTVSRIFQTWWERISLDVILLALAVLLFWQQSRHGFQLVLAPEGVARAAVSYTAFAAPMFLWLGAALLVIRLTHMLLSKDSRAIVPPLRIFGTKLAPLVGASMSRQRDRLAIGVVMVALAVAFATSTAIFNGTYEQQALVDAELTNGADVTVTGVPSADLSSQVQPIASLPGVVAVESMQHQYAYVGTDLQDLYGINPSSFASAARLSDTYFAGTPADEAMKLLATTENGVLISPETVSDFQLQPGDTVKLRIQSARDHQYHVVPFTVAGTVREFPTAPSDSFLVANASYLAQQTGSSAPQTLLVRTDRSPSSVASQVRAVLGATSGATVQDIATQRQITRSSLAAMSLHGLTSIELILAILLAIASAGLVLSLGLDERRRMLAIASALGATPRQLGAFVWSEAGLVLGGGQIAGLLLGWGVALTLVKVLTQVFDPPPVAPSIPWLYLLGLVVATTVSAIAAANLAVRNGEHGVLETIRQL